MHILDIAIISNFFNNNIPLLLLMAKRPTCHILLSPLFKKILSTFKPNNFSIGKVVSLSHNVTFTEPMIPELSFAT